MLKMREVKTGSGNTVVQVIYNSTRKRIILKHIGSGKDESEIVALRVVAIEFIKDYTQQLPVFPYGNPHVQLSIEHTLYIGFYYRFFYETIQKLLVQLDLDKVCTNLLSDLVIIRVLEPASKLRSIELLETYFGIFHRRQS